MIMAGIVSRENDAVKLCGSCGDITLVSIIFGIMLWLMAMFGLQLGAAKETYCFFLCTPAF